MRFKLSKINLYIILLTLPTLIFLSVYNHSFKRFLLGFSYIFISAPSTMNDALSESMPVMKTKKELLREIKRLQKANEELYINSIIKESLIDENKELRKLLNFTTRTQLSYILARVISRDPISWNRKFRVNRGSKYGVKIGQAVLANGYLVGRIKEITAVSAIVIMITDKNCKVSVRKKSSKITGILEGWLSSEWNERPICKVKYLPRDIKFLLGEIFVTSGFGTLIPPDIPVGSLVPWDSKTNTTSHTINHAYKNIKLVPFAETKKMKFVTILINDN